MLLEPFKKLVQEAINNKAIKERELEYFKKRYGFNGSAPKTLEEVGKELHRTRENVRLRVNKAMDELSSYISKKDEACYSAIVNMLKNHILVDTNKYLELLGDTNNDAYPVACLLLDMLDTRSRNGLIYFCWKEIPSFEDCVKLRKQITKLLYNQPEYYTPEDIREQLKSKVNASIIEIITKDIPNVAFTGSRYYIETKNLKTTESCIYRLLTDKGQKMTRQEVYDGVAKIKGVDSVNFSISDKSHIDTIGKTGYWVLKKWNVDTNNMVDTIINVFKSLDNKPMPMKDLCTKVYQVRDDISESTIKSYVYTHYKYMFKIINNKVSVKKRYVTQ